MKRSLALCLCAVLLLSGCSQKDSTSTQDNTPAPNETHTQNSPSAPETDADGTRLAYYEALVGELQRELLDLKTELYATRVEYEARMEELVAGNGQGSDTPPVNDAESEVTESAQFGYVLKDNGAVITSYSGDAKKLTIPAKLDGHPVLAIGDRAFMDHTELISVTLPESVTSLGWFAFSGCVSLEYVTVPASVQSVSYGAFLNCPSTMTVQCPAGSYGEQYARSYGLRTVIA